MIVTNRPLAAEGLISYRYSGRYGWVMIGAKDDQDALRQAQLSTGEVPLLENLQVWDGNAYKSVSEERP